MTDPIADMLTRIRNASLIKKVEVVVPYSRLKFAIAEILRKEGYIAGIEKVRAKTGLIDEIKITLKYRDDRQSAIHSLRRISTPGRRLYCGYRDIPAFTAHQGATILSTPQGLMTAKEARSKKLGGEIVCEIY